MKDCRDCLHTPSGKCFMHDPKNEGMSTVTVKYVSEYKERLFNPDDTLEDIVRRGSTR